MEQQHVIYDVRGAEGRITLNRPEKRNAYTLEMIDAIAAALESARDDERVRVVVLAARGPAFSAGADMITERHQSIAERRRRTERLYIHLHRLHKELGKPSIAAMAGAARGGGCTLAFMCDMIVATRDTTLALPEIDRGKLAGYHLVHLPRVIGPARAFEFTMSGRVMSAEEAERLGIFTRLVDGPEELEAAVAELVEAFSAKSPEALALGKDVFYRCMDMEMIKGLRVAVDALTSLVASGETDRGIDAFAAGRKR